MAQLPRLAEMRPNALPSDAANGLLWRDVAAASRPTSIPAGLPAPLPVCCSYAAAATSDLSAGTWGDSGAEQGQSSELASARMPEVSDPRTAHAHGEGSSLKFGCFSGYGDSAPSATSLWQPDGAVSLPLSQRPPYAVNGPPAAPPFEQGAPSAAGSHMEHAMEHQLRLRMSQLEDRASAAEHRLVAAEQENEMLRQRSDPRSAGRQAELSRRMAIVQEQHGQHHGSLRERIVSLETDLDSMLLEPLLESSATLEQAQRVSSEADRKLLLLEERSAVLATAEASQRCAEQQRAQLELSTLADEIRSALGAQHTCNPGAHLSGRHTCGGVGGRARRYGGGACT